MGYTDDKNPMTSDLITTVLTQYHINKGIKKFGQAGIDAVVVELKQLHDRMVVDPKNPYDMTTQEKHAALQYLMFLKQKRCGKIKGRGCADGRKKIGTIDKTETSAPTVATEALMITCVIDATEGRDVETVDISGAFMQAGMEGDDVHMKMEGKMAELLVKLDPKLYRKYITSENGKSVLYVTPKKALYGTLQAAMMFWKMLSTSLQEWGFKINPYDWCVANKIVDGKQLTIVWHVDDLKISHANPAVVTTIIDQLKSEYGKESPLTVKRGKLHDYLGMLLDYKESGKVKIDMSKYLKEILEEVTVDFDGIATSRAANHLFEINDDCESLPEEKAIFFHHIVYKLLFLCKRGRPDIQTAIEFLTMRVKCPDHDDLKKLYRVIKYLQSTSELVLTLECDESGNLLWWVDASFAVHHDMKRHTGGMMSMGKGSIYSCSTKQKLNTKSSTESELVGVDDVMPIILWMRYFLEAQGLSFMITSCIKIT